MAHATNYFAWQGRLAAPELGLRVIEVGCGIGNFTGMLLDRETVLAVDVDPACIERLQQRYSNHPNLRASVCEPSSGAFADLARFHPDSCVCLNVLEHIEDDTRALEAMASSARLSSSMCSSTFRQTQESGWKRAKSANAPLDGSQTDARKFG
jgi:2-polyprenyl-3-methyl-5-hydroxy-6-metoxy-1,4-benzoquinol methylase